MRENNNKQNVLQYALELFSERGYENVGVQELVNAACITKPTLYYYFGSKDGVLKELLKTHYDALNQAIKNAAVYDPHPHSYYDDVYPVLIQVAGRYFLFAKHNPLFYRIVLSMQYLPPTSQTCLFGKEYHDVQYEIIETLFMEISKIHPNMKNKEKRYSWMLIGMINTFIGLWYNQSINLSDDIIKDSVKQFMHGIFV